MKYSIYLIIYSIIIFYNTNTYSQNKDVRQQVLILSTDGFSYPYTQIFTSNYKTEFKERGIKAQFIYESLNLYMFSDDKDSYYRSLVKSYQIKYKNRQPDLIMAVEFAAAEFLLEYGDEIFNNTPVITSGTNELNNIIKKDNWYQVFDTLDIRKMLYTIKQLRPETRTITVILGSSYFEKEVAEFIKSKFKNTNTDFEVRFTIGLSYNELLERIKTPEPDETFYYYYFFEDSNGKKFVPIEVLNDLNTRANIPFFVYTENFVSGKNIIGGYVVSTKNLALFSAQKSIEILRKTDYLKTSQVFIFSSNINVFNWDDLNKYNIPIRKLPEGSIVLNKKPTVWELYWHYIVIALTVLSLQTILIVMMLKNRTKRHKAENKIIEINRNLEKTIENQISKIKVQNQILEKSYQQLLDLQNHKEQLTTMIVHDLKNPLSTLINMPSLLPPKEKKEMKNYLTNKMLVLVMNILDVQKFEENKLELNKSKIDISNTVENAIKQLKYNIVAKNINVKINSSVDAIVSVDSELIERAVINILSNSLKFTETNGTIAIDIYKTKNQMLKIQISDNGIGIKQSKLNTIFNKFQQTGTRIKYSSGLGLTFCKMAIEAHGGTIWFDTSYTRGARVLFTLPYIKNEMSVKLHGKTSENKATLTEAEKQSLLKVLPLLKNSKTNEISHLRKVLKTIDDEQLVNQQWCAALKNAIYTCNDLQYRMLINEIEQK